MRAHHVIEGMDWLATLYAERGSSECFDPELWGSVRCLYGAAVNFDFGSACPNQEHIEFGSDLHDKGIFQLPFEATFITAHALGTDHSILVTCFDDTDEFTCVSTTGVRLKKDNPRAWPVPVCAMRVTKDRVDWRQLIDLPYFRRSTGEETEFDGERFQAHVSFAYGALSMLMSKDVEQNIEPASDKLNRSRERKGRPATREVRHITIRSEAAPQYEGAAESFQKGHSSPRMHWRRGHIRKISGGRFVPVAPCIVNSTDELRTVARKVYRVHDTDREAS